MRDMAFGFMAVINVVAILILTPIVNQVARHYLESRRQSQRDNTEITFVAQDIALNQTIDPAIWRRNNSTSKSQRTASFQSNKAFVLKSDITVS